ncbi:MAG: Fe-Mn family superoxide dismutase [Candidatus Uhrbacteria bacterium]|nr:Fe-Mn family superoxide dismutase [Candidatus Uhrbacteria bacterium]
MKTEAAPLPFKSLIGISDKTMAIHHDKLYVGYVNKLNEVSEKLMAMNESGVGLDAANQTYSDLRALRDAETFAVNGVYLHEYYFEVLGGDGKPTGALVDDLTEKYGSLEKFITFFSATGMAVRGWVVLCWDTQAKKLKIYGSDAHSQGGVWGCLPILVLDVYEHAYFIDYGSDRKAYIADWWKNIDWKKANELYENTK